MEKLNILINAYAVSPTWGSEPGVGWNWITNIARQCNVFVITESEWENDIKKALKNLPQKDNIHFFFNPVPQEVRDMCWRQGDWRFYRYYRKWQKKAFEIAKQIICNHRIDIIHQLNMIGFREPGYLWKINGIPFIWGPIGNMAPLPLDYLKGSPSLDKAKQFLKNMISYYQARSGRVKKAIKRADQLITVLDSTASIIKHTYNKDAIVMPETGLNITAITKHTSHPDTPLKLLWVGRFIPTKKLDIAISILSSLKYRQNFELHIVGWGTEAEEKRYRELAVDKGVSDQCIWHGKIPNDRVQELMKGSDIFLFTSVVEGTPHVVLEAIANNLPVVCFDMCGQGVIVNDLVGWKIPVRTLSESADRMRDILDDIESCRDKINVKSNNCEIRKPELSWENKINQIVEIYKSLIEK